MTGRLAARRVGWDGRVCTQRTAGAGGYQRAWGVSFPACRVASRCLTALRRVWQSGLVVEFDNLIMVR